MVLKYSRILLKISGEGLMGDKNFGHDFNFIDSLASSIKSVRDQGVALSLVVGGGNIYRGSQSCATGASKATHDYMGMLATVINALAIQNALQSISVDCRVMSAIPMNTVCEPYIRLKAANHLDKGRVVIFAAGTANPFFTTDTAAVLRAIEMNCDALFKATQVDGVYSSDPTLDPNAVRFDKLNYMDLLSKDLKIMDAASISLARENSLPILVFSLKNNSSILSAVKGKGMYTLISDEN